jgi:branched-chain amino acid transport system permease protein
MAAEAGQARRAPPEHVIVPALLFAGLLAVPLVAHVLDQPFIVSFATRVAIVAIAALSLDFILGYGAMVSFGHAAFIGIGAYAIGISAEHGVTDMLVTIPIALGASALFALVTGAVSLKTRGVHFIMITLAFGQMAFFTAVSLSRYGGDDGLTIWGRSTLLGTEPFADDTAFYLVVLACLASLYLLCRIMIASRFGRVLRATRQNPVRVTALGLDPYTYRLAAYVIAGVIAGLSGALLANHTEFVSPATMTWQRSGELIAMVVLGGMGSLVGAVLGAVVFLGLEEVLAHVFDYWRLAFGPILVLVALFGRGGLAGLLARRNGHD